MMRRGLMILLGFLLFGSLAIAEESRLSWSQLPEQTQTVLKPFASEWDGLPEERRARLLKGVERWQGMTPEQHGIMGKRFNRWQAMSPEQQLEVRQRFKRFRQLPAEERALLKRKYQRFQGMPSERRQALRERWKNLTPDERKDFRDKREKRMQQRLEHGLPGARRLPVDRGLNRPHLRDVPAMEMPQDALRDR